MPSSTPPKVIIILKCVLSFLLFKYLSEKIPPHPHLLEGGGRLQAGDDWDDRQTHGETASQGKCRGGGGVGVRQTDKDGVLRRLADRWGRGSQEKNGQT